MTRLKHQTRSVTFALEQFTWSAPDRLELTGTFDGLEAAPTGLPALVLTGDTGTYRLTATPDDVSGTPQNGEPWSAAFVWHEAPAAFDAAVLELGDDLAIDLPVPGADADTAALAARAASAPDPGEAQGLDAEVDRLTLWEDLHEAREHARRLGEELARARADLATEIEGRADDAARYRAGLAQIRESAEAALNEQADGLSSAADEAEQLRAQLETARAEADDARHRIATVREALQIPEAGHHEG